MDVTQVSVELEGDLKRKIDALKNYYGIQSSAELIRVLVNEKAKQLNAAPLEANANGSR
jgi:metal-responsive CopG/Arc/MetJ family transcriptional regulator